MKNAVTFFCALMMAAVALFTGSPASGDLLVNPGFELAPFSGTEEAGAGIGWSYFDAGAGWLPGGVFRIQGQAPGAHGGTVALRLFGNTSAGQEFAASPGQSFYGGAWILNASLAPMTSDRKAGVGISWYDSAGNRISFESNEFASWNAPLDTWGLKTITAVAPPGTARGYFGVYTSDWINGSGLGSPRFDDAFLQVIPEPNSITLLTFVAIGLVARRRRR